MMVESGGMGSGTSTAVCPLSTPSTCALIHTVDMATLCPPRPSRSCPDSGAAPAGRPRSALGGPGRHSLSAEASYQPGAPPPHPPTWSKSLRIIYTYRWLQVLHRKQRLPFCVVPPLPPRAKHQKTSAKTENPPTASYAPQIYRIPANNNNKMPPTADAPVRSHAQRTTPCHMHHSIGIPSTSTKPPTCAFFIVMTALGR